MAIKKSDYKSFEVWIPKEISKLDNINWTQKVMLSNIKSLHDNDKCYSNNEYFGRVLFVSISQVNRMLQDLENKDYILRVNENNRRIIKYLGKY